jgi:hypothetical protein
MEGLVGSGAQLIEVSVESNEELDEGYEVTAV